MSLPTALCLSWCGTRRGERHRNTGPYSPQAHKDQFGERRIAFGGQRSIQLSYGCVEVHLADWPGLGNGLQGLKRGRSKAPKAKVTRSNRVGCARKARADRAGTVAGQPLKAGRERQRFSQSESLG
jgi:hypothetical protein